MRLTDSAQKSRKRRNECSENFAKKECSENFAKNVFVIMRYGKKPQYGDIERAIKDTLRRYGLTAILARDVQYEDDLWPNVKFCMDNSRYAIVVFEDIARTPVHSPNVALELGYMMALGRKCLILKEESLSGLFPDVIGKIYKLFDADQAHATVQDAVSQWLENVVGAGVTKRAESITDDDPIIARKLRTRRIMEAYERILKSGKKAEIRLAGIVSALAVSPEAPEDTTAELHALYLCERKLLLELLRTGSTIRCMICPDIYLERLHDKPALADKAKRNYLPRYDALLAALAEHIDNHSLQMVWCEQLPRHGLIIIGEEVAFVGTRTPHEQSTRTTVIYDPEVVQHEIKEFEYAFEDTIKQFIAKKGCKSTEDALYRKLRFSVQKKVRECRQELSDALASVPIGSLEWTPELRPFKP